ncbi:hypothetical protein QVD17_37947 [Tagetes erecta]|uniref:Uncharacterized protein n=1 Tax=Tagetes erecta TaxID=13708 RepID=A0AAD8JV57_TARER|nr:hypothetical protein QVD17_37947 [Tagetes erecta]
MTMTMTRSAIRSVCTTLLADMQEMRNCYDGLLSAAAATANSIYGKCFDLFRGKNVLFWCIGIRFSDMK